MLCGEQWGLLCLAGGIKGEETQKLCLRCPQKSDMWFGQRHLRPGTVLGHRVTMSWQWVRFQGGGLRSKGGLRPGRAVRPALCHQPVVTGLSVPSFVEGL